MLSAIRQAALLGCFASLGIFAAEALNATRCVDETLLASKERVAARADFHVDVALVGRARLKIVSAGANDAHRSIVRVNLFLRHLWRQTFPASYLFHCMKIWGLKQTERHGDGEGLAVEG
jgi:hypothetical protein